ncbi:hypothetical protein ACFLTT_00365 [Chloroflexota bacterium]
MTFTLKQIKKCIASFIEKDLSKQQGSSLIENLAAIAIFGAISVVFLAAITSVTFSSGMLEGKSTAENLARNQIEDIKCSPYESTNSYPITVSCPSEYSILINVQDISPVDYPNTLQDVVVSVYKEERQLSSLECYKANR